MPYNVRKKLAEHISSMIDEIDKAMNVIQIMEKETSMEDVDNQNKLSNCMQRIGEQAARIIKQYPVFVHSTRLF